MKRPRDSEQRPVPREEARSACLPRASARVFAGGCSALLLAGAAWAQDAGGDGASPDNAQRLQRMEMRLAEQDRQIDALRVLVERQQQALDAVTGGQRSAHLDELRARGADSALPGLPLAIGAGIATYAPAADGATRMEDTAGTSQAATAAQQGDALTPVGRPPEQAERPPEIAQIFEQPGVLTPKGRFILEPSLQLGYSSNDRVALVGYTVIPAILIGLIDVRQVKTSSLTASLAARYGVSRRLELELKAPFSYINTDTVSREIFTGSAQDKVFNANGSGMGDVELTTRLQLNRG